MKKDYIGEKKVIYVKSQTLHCDFETLVMQEKESLQEFFTRALAIVNHMKFCSVNVSSKTIVNKVLRRLTKKMTMLLQLKSQRIYLAISLMN